MKIIIALTGRTKDVAGFLVLILFFSLNFARAQSTNFINFTISISSPTNGGTFASPANIALQSAVVDTNAMVESVQYFSGNSLIGSSTQGSSFPLTWSNVTAGTYSLTAIATDFKSNMATSAPVNITVSGSTTNPPPLAFNVGFLHPTAGETFTAPTSILLHAWVTDSNQVGEVEFFSNGNLVGAYTNNGVLLTNMNQSSPFLMTWTNVPAGTYSLTALALDEMGNTATSAPVNITVNGSSTNPPPVPFEVGFDSPTNGETYTAPGNVGLNAWVTDSNQVGEVEFFSNGNFIGFYTNNGVLLTNMNQSSPFSLTWTNAPAGTYSLTALALDERGKMATSAPVNITVSGSTTNNPPPPPIAFDIGFFYPTNGETYSAPTNVGLHAWVTDSNLVDTVVFYANGNFLGFMTNNTSVPITNMSQGSPFYLTWSNAPAGNYNLTAVGYDSMGNMATSAPVNITVSGSTTNNPPPLVPFEVGFNSPTNGETYTAPGNVGLNAWITDSNEVWKVEFFSNGNFIGFYTNNGVLLTNMNQSSPFYLTWTNAPAGTYSLTALALDERGKMATSAPVNITVSGSTTNNPPPPPIAFDIGFFYPTNGETYITPANVGLHAWVTDSNLVDTVVFYANGNFLGFMTNNTSVPITNMSQGSPFYLTWTNAPAGNYDLTAVGYDSLGNMATSAPVNITVSGSTTNSTPPQIPFEIGFLFPTNGQSFNSPAEIPLHAWITDSNEVWEVEYFSNGSLIGFSTNNGVLLTNMNQFSPFTITWSNVPASTYTLTALALDEMGNTATSAPVNITVNGSSTNPPPVVSIYAPDPMAIKGTNCPNICVPATIATNYIIGTNTATFLVHRNSETNVNLTVNYSIGGTASNGVDYVLIPNWVNIPVGSSYALIAVTPLNNTNSTCGTVILKLLSSTNVPPAYTVGSPSSAGAIIMDGSCLPITRSTINCMPDGSLYCSLPATNGMNFCFQVSSNMMTWLPACTNTVLKGSAIFVDPNGPASPGWYYRIVPVSAPASY